MEKYIIILVILATIYFIQNNLKTTEGFETTTSQSVFGVDDLNAVNTLAQISRQLMSGGLTVPGNMIVNGKTTINSGLNVVAGMNDIFIKADLSPNGYNPGYGNVKFMHTNETQGTRGVLRQLFSRMTSETNFTAKNANNSPKKDAKYALKRLRKIIPTNKYKVK